MSGSFASFPNRLRPRRRGTRDGAFGSTLAFVAIFGGAGDLVRQLTPSAIAQRTAGEIKDKFRRGEYGGLMTPERLTQAIDRHGGTTALKHWTDERNGDVDAAALERSLPRRRSSVSNATTSLRSIRDDWTMRCGRCGAKFRRTRSSLPD